MNQDASSDPSSLDNGGYNLADNDLPADFDDGGDFGGDDS
jgi:hypothetical protein